MTVENSSSSEVKFLTFYSLLGNIFISRTSVPIVISEEGDDDDWTSRVVFKIGKGAWNQVYLFFCYISFENIICSLLLLNVGDLGHVTRISSPQVEEGDSRFLANEVLQEVNNAL